jgi:hypothetical protein
MNSLNNWLVPGLLETLVPLSALFRIIIQAFRISTMALACATTSSERCWRLTLITVASFVGYFLPLFRSSFTVDLTLSGSRFEYILLLVVVGLCSISTYPDFLLGVCRLVRNQGMFLTPASVRFAFYQGRRLSRGPLLQILTASLFLGIPRFANNADLMAPNQSQTFLHLYKC